MAEETSSNNEATEVPHQSTNGFLDPRSANSVDTPPSVNPAVETSAEKRQRPSSISLDVDSMSFAGDDESTTPFSYSFSASTPTSHRVPQAAVEKDGEGGMKSMYRFTLYETSARYYLIGHDILEKNFRVLKIDRTSPPGQLNIFEDENIYSRHEISELLTTIEDGNKGSGGLKVKCSCWGVLGFIRFTESYYMFVITKRTQAAMIGGHYIYEIEATDLIPLTSGPSARFQRDRNPEESRYLTVFSNMDMTKSFYYSYTYNITHTLQTNMVRERTAFNEGMKRAPRDWNDMFVWNNHLLEPATKALKHTYDWCIPVIHGFIKQASLDVFGRRVYLTIIARRSRFFAGARYLKRGSNDLGYVANDVETEQIVSDVITTSFHAPGPKLYANPNYTSYVQHRGSIPLYWTQENSGVTPKPAIDMSLVDPFYSAAALHFDNLFDRYGAPVYVLNLIKARERTPRESKLLQEFQKALLYLNQSLPSDKKILYKAYDMSRAAKTRGQDVVGTLEIIAEEILHQTGFFHNGDAKNEEPTMQNGVARTNCIDCLDRTNAAQFVIGKRALGRQLQVLGVISESAVEYETDAVNIFTNIYHSHGDTIAFQYGGSHLAHTMSTYRKLNEWKSHSRDMVESFKRYYHNSFLDSQRQEAYNLFLGNYIYAQGQPMLWDLPTDYYLHHSDPRVWSDRQRRDYINWYTPDFLEPRTLPPVRDLPRKILNQGITSFDDYWLEYYRPLAISSFVKIFSWKLNLRPRYLHDGGHHDGGWNPSPFVPRKLPLPQEPESPGKRSRKGVTIVEPQSEDAFSIRSIPLDGAQNGHPSRPEYSAIDTEYYSADKSLIAQWTMKQFHDSSLNPSLTNTEEAEYTKYVNHPLKLPLVISSEEPDLKKNTAFAAYVNSVNLDTGMSRLGNGDSTVSEEDLADYEEFLMVDEDPLTVTEEELSRKRYKAYRQWLKGKSFFKQSKVDPEYRSQN